MPREQKSRRRAWRRRQVRRRRILIGAGVSLLLVVIAATALAYQGLQVRSSLVRAESQSRLLQQQIGRNEASAAKVTLGELQRSTAEARSGSSGVLWKLAGKAPLVGSNVRAVSTVSRVLDEIATGVEPVVSAANKVGPSAFTPKDGRLNLQTIESIRPALSDANRALTLGVQQLEGINKDGLFGPLQDPIEDLRTKVRDARSTTSSGLRATQLLPEMLGRSGKRSYILAFQNNAEIRSTGGLTGAFAILGVNDGRLQLESQGAAVDFGFFDPPVVKLTADERNLYSNLMAGFWGDTNFTPDFPRTAQIMRVMMQKKFRKTVDGTVSIDPIALSYILSGTGPIKLADGSTLTSKNAVQLLLNQVYLDENNDPARQDAYFADAARRVFDAVASGQGDPAAVIRGMARAVGQGRILVQSSHRDEQAILALSEIGGALIGDDGATPHLGLYLNDSTATKLQYYLRRKTSVRAVKCSNAGVQTLSTSTVLSSAAPANAAQLPDSILGPGTGEKRGSMRMNLRFYAPFGGEMTSLAVNGEPKTINFGEHLGRQVAVVSVLLAPGEKVTVATTIKSGASQRNSTIFSTTPGIETSPNNVVVKTACD